MNLIKLLNKGWIYKSLMVSLSGTQLLATEVTLEKPDGFYIPSGFPNKFQEVFKVNSPLIEIESEDLERSGQMQAQPNNFYAVNLSGEQLQESKFNSINSIGPFIVKLSMSNTELDNAFLENLGQFSNLILLNINNTFINDDGMVYLECLSNLRGLCMVYTKVTAKGITHLLKLKNLQLLDAGCTYIGNEGIRVISQSTSLRYLNVRACNFDDTALDYFLTIPTLTFLNIGGNRSLTSKGIQRFLSQKRERLHVVYD